jgi:hypothetical protein
MSKKSLILLMIATFALALVPSAAAIPAFARQYGTSCTTCHIDFPKLNDFGKAFKDAGFKFPKDDEEFLKIPPVMLGAAAQKEMWPNAVWPGTIPGMPPIGLRMNTFFQVVSKNRNNYNQQTPGTVGTFTPRTDFQPGLFSIFTAGNFGDGIAFWVDEDFSVGGSNADGGLGDGYLKFVDIGRLLKLPKDSLSLRVGQFELDLPFSPARSWNLSAWDIFDQANMGTASDNVSNSFALSSAAQGVEFSGGHSYGGYHYSLAVVNQNTSGGANPGSSVDPAVSFFSDANFKDLYGRVSYRFNLEQDAASRQGIQAAGAKGPHDHTYLDLGGFGFYGRSVLRNSDGTNVFTAREPFYRIGGNASFNYRNFNLFGVYMYGRDRNQIPAATPTGFAPGPSVHFGGGFVEADYMALPWMMTIMRWDAVNSAADRVNSIGTTGPTWVHSTRHRITPGVQFLIHANIKASFEYQYRPVQVVTDPTTGATINGPFRTNSAVAGLEWVY